LRTCITYHEKFSQYDLGINHPFRGDRFIKAKSVFDKKGLSQSPNIYFIKPTPCKTKCLLKVHPKSYVDQIYKLAEFNEYYTLDTPVSKSILEGLMFMIGGTIETGAAIFQNHVKRAIALGGGFHHAGYNYGGGFCLFNDIAILVEDIREKYAVKRILLLDYDVHFGNGTSDIFYSDPDVLYISLHQDPRTLYPWKGFIHEVGEGEGEGFNINVPLPLRTGEQTYLNAFKEIFPPLAEEFKPDIIIANGGSDAHFADHLGSLGLTAKGFFELSQIIGNVSEKVCNDKAILLIISGYNITVLPYSWYALAAGFTKYEEVREKIKDYYPAPKDPWKNQQHVKNSINVLKKLLKKYWKCF
jgi:acetoin utilization protein AcuC